MVKFACYEPIKEAQKAKFFKVVGSKDTSRKLQYEVADCENEGNKKELLEFSGEDEVKFRDVRMVRKSFLEGEC